NGEGKTFEMFDEDNPNDMLDALSISMGKKVIYNQDGIQIGLSDKPLRMGKREMVCDICKGSKVVQAEDRATIQVPCPKEDALKSLLEDYEEYGRVVIFAGFTGAVDRCVRTCKEEGWQVIRLDGRGWWSTMQGNSAQLQNYFDNPSREGPLEKIAFIGQSDAAGMG